MSSTPLVLISHERCLEHQAGRQHPERPERLPAVLEGVSNAGLGSDLQQLVAEPAPRELLVAIHGQAHVAKLEELDRQGGGRLDPDTRMNEASLAAATLASGAGLQAIEALDAGASAAFCAVRPPGHHATPTQSMGFCLINNAAVAAAVLADRGERVLIVDYDAHHGNGTQDVFWNDPRVMYVSYHQFPFYPGSGSLSETGGPDAPGTTVNMPLPPGATGDVYRQAWDQYVLPQVEAFAPTWLILSAGFDAHRLDPLTDMGLSAGDYGQLTALVAATVPAGRRLVFLEGGYDLDGLRLSTEAMVRALVGDDHQVEPPTSGGPGAEIIAAALGTA